MPAALKLLPTSLQDKGEAEQNRAPTPQELERALRSTFEEVLQGATSSDQATFMAYEATLVAQVRQLGQLLLMLFLCVREQRRRAELPPTVTCPVSTSTKQRRLARRSQPEIRAHLFLLSSRAYSGRGKHGSLSRLRRRCYWQCRAAAG